ncbi:sialin-like isoform X1 [Tenebrio molitor]|uniref:sialin-like isoform X1 n=1 Tax=Tenebrio molitor TaxID=7067 RepID=UPI003624A1B3
MFESLTCQRILSFMVFLSFMIHHMLRINISIAIVEMVAKNNTTSATTAPRYDWDEAQKNNILGCFFWGYLLTQIPGGRLSELFGPKRIIGGGLLTASLLTILTPLASYSNYYCLLVIRVVLGVVMGIHWPSTPPIATRWIPPTDTSRFLSHMAAASLGVVITLPMCGYLIDSYGWPSVFYVTGTIVLTWTLCWLYLVYDTPDQHPRITEDEKQKLREMIQRDLDLPSKTRTPWAKILTSGPVWAFIVANACSSFTFFVCFMQLPTYMDQILHFNIKQNGLLSSIPHLARYLSALTSSCIADKLKKTGNLSTTCIRKFLCSTLFGGTSVLFVIQAFWGQSSVVSVVIFTSSMGLHGLATSGVYVNSLDLASSYSGTIFGMSQVLVAMTGYLVTKLVALLTIEDQSFQQWVYMFWILVGVNLFAMVYFIVFGSGEEQNWNSRSSKVEMEQLRNETSKNELTNKALNYEQ